MQSFLGHVFLHAAGSSKRRQHLPWACSAGPLRTTGTGPSRTRAFKPCFGASTAPSSQQPLGGHRNSQLRWEDRFSPLLRIQSLETLPPRITLICITLPHILYDSICIQCVKSVQTRCCCQVHAALSSCLSHGGGAGRAQGLCVSLLLGAAARLTSSPAPLLGSTRDRTQSGENCSGGRSEKS